jgi:hypothetical protein
MSKTKMFVLTETSPFMMSYVIITEKGNCVIVDGGRPEDVPLLREKVKGRKIKAWFLTHPHLDHITAFNKLVKDGDPDFNFEKVYYNFPDSSFVSKDRSEDVETQKEFNEIFPLIKDKAQVVYTGDIINIDELSIEILYHYDAKYNFVKPTINDTSIAFKVTTPRSSVMFLGDLGAEAGEVLVEQGEEKLKAEYCQMAHHGHGCVGPDVYMHISPRVCIWNAPSWLYEEAGRLQDYRCYGTKRTRWWMEKIGVKEHIVTKDGTAEIEL